MSGNRFQGVRRLQAALEGSVGLFLSFFCFFPFGMLCFHS
ncbi:hypothetical protein HMPREF3036_01581 [Sutterella sp. KLE1602]|nr:hypothetical protein HMPREF3036_01581 [Sutterella sp. KLE1602]